MQYKTPHWDTIRSILYLKNKTFKTIYTLDICINISYIRTILILKKKFSWKFKAQALLVHKFFIKYKIKQNKLK